MKKDIAIFTLMGLMIAICVSLLSLLMTGAADAYPIGPDMSAAALISPIDGTNPAALLEKLEVEREALRVCEREALESHGRCAEACADLIAGIGCGTEQRVAK